MCDATAVARYRVKAHGDDNPTGAQAMKSNEANNWRDAARSEMQNFERHGVYIEVSEDQLPSWNASTIRAFEVIDMMLVLRKKRDENVEILKFNGASCRLRQSTKAQTPRVRRRTHA
eukprot:3147209-Pleurochrysis_carterae.AAC.1